MALVAGVVIIGVIPQGAECAQFYPGADLGRLTKMMVSCKLVCVALPSQFGHLVRAQPLLIVSDWAILFADWLGVSVARGIF